MTSHDKAVVSLRDAFPARLLVRADRAIAELPPTRLPPSYGFSVKVAEEEVVIPYRIYNPEPPWAAYARPLTSDILISDCIYSRHHDGLVRQRHLASLLAADDEWVVPFVLQLLGEYVLEIVQQLQTNLATLAGPQYSRFTNENPEFVERTKSRIISYWNCYYRSKYRKFSEYPGYLVADWLAWWCPHDARKIRAR